MLFDKIIICEIGIIDLGYLENEKIVNRTGYICHGLLEQLVLFVIRITNYEFIIN